MNSTDNPRILIVESDDSAAEALEVMLKKHFAAEVARAHSLAEARRKLAGESFDVVSLGYFFDDGDGLDLLTDIHSKKGHPPVIMVTAYGSEEVASRAIASGAAGYIVKNEDLEKNFVKGVENALEKVDGVRMERALRESESFYRTLFEDAGDALFVETIEGVIEDANEAAERMLGYSRGELAGKSAIAFVPPEKRSDFESAQEALLSGGEVMFENVSKDGRVIPIRVKAREVLTRRGPRYLVTARDVSDIRRVEGVLQSEREFFHRALDAIREIFLLVDGEARLLQWNESVGRVTGYGDFEIGTLSLRDLFRPEDSSRIMSALSAVSQTGIQRRIETTLVTSDRRHVPFDITATPVKDDTGGQMAVAVLGRDVSDRKRAEEALRKMVRETNERREEITALLESTRLVLERKGFKEAARDIFMLCRDLIGSGAGMVALTEEGRTGILFAEPADLADSFGPEDFTRINYSGERDFQSGKAFVENDFAPQRVPHEDIEDRFGVENTCIAPLMAGGRVSGFMGLMNKKGGFTKRDALMAAAFGEVASLALQNARSIEMLQQSEERFRSVAETANDAIICVDGRLDITFWNRGAAELFGYEPEEVSGRPLDIIIPERMRASRLEALREAARSEGRGKTYESVGLRKDGSEFFMEMSRSSPWRVGDEVYLTTIVRDVSERKAAEEALLRSEAEYRAVVEEQTELITRFVPGARITFVNQAYAKYFGRPREQLLEIESFLDLVPSEDHRLVIDAVKKLSCDNPVVTVEHRAINGEGEVRWQQWMNRGIFDEGGRLVEVQAVGRDVTDVRLAEEALKESERKYKLLFDMAPDVIYSLDAKGRITVLNQAFEALTGYKAEEWLGGYFAPLLHPEDVEVGLRTFHEATSGMTPELYELRLRHKDGGYVIGEFISRPLLADGEPVGEFGIARDVTDRKRAEQELQALNNELEGYAHVVSHDLKGPLASIGAASATMQALLKGVLNPDNLDAVMEMSSIITNNVAKADSLIEGILELAEASQRPVDVTLVDIRDVVDEVLQERRDIISKRKVKVVADRNLGSVEASPTHMYQLFSNLIDNAIKHNESRKPLVSVVYEGRDENGAHHYVVKDNGDGIDPDEAGRIFLPFFARKKGCTGLGLATVSKVAGVYGGHVHVENDDGARFEIVIHDAKGPGPGS